MPGLFKGGGLTSSVGTSLGKRAGLVRRERLGSSRGELQGCVVAAVCQCCSAEGRHAGGKKEDRVKWTGGSH